MLRKHGTPQTNGGRFPYGFRPAGEIAEPVLRRICSPHGLILVRVLREWERIAGNEFANRCRPGRIGRNRGRTVLHVRVDGAWATELAHRTPAMLERIHAAFGTDAIDEIRVTQVGCSGPRRGQARKTGAALPARSAGPSPADPALRRRTLRTLASVGNPDLRAALGRLHLAIQVRDQGPEPQHRRSAP